MIRGYSVILVRVKDLELERRFYEEALGFELRREIPGTLLSFAVPGGPQIELVPNGTIVPPVNDRFETPLIAIFHVDDVAGFADRLVEHGGRMVNAPFERGGHTLAYVADPEGHVIGLHSHSQTEDAKKS